MKMVMKKAKAPAKIKYVIPKVEDCVLVVKVGSDERPASSEDITSVAEAMKQLSKELRAGDDTFLVTHHAIVFVAIPRGLLLNEPVVKG